MKKLNKEKYKLYIEANNVRLNQILEQSKRI